MTTSLQQITDTWGNWWAGQVTDSGGMAWTASTNYAAQDRLGDYMSYQVVATPGPFQWGTPRSTPGEQTSQNPVLVNGTSVQQSQTFEAKVTTKQEASQTTSKTVELGVSLSAEVDLPSIAKVTGTTSLSTTLSNSTASSKSTDHEWSALTPVLVPPYSEVDAQLVIDTLAFEVDWTTTVALTGYVASWFNNSVGVSPTSGSHYCYFTRIEQVLLMLMENNVDIDLTGYNVQYMTQAVVDAAGTLSGNAGLKSRCVFSQKPLPSGDGGSAQVKSWTVPMSHAPIGADVAQAVA